MELRITIFEREDKLDVELQLKRDGLIHSSSWLSDGPCELADALRILPGLVEKLAGK